MSLDFILISQPKLFSVSIPLEQGGVFRRKSRVNVEVNFTVSIPLEQGGVFRPYGLGDVLKAFEVSIPLEQGGVFRQILVLIKSGLFKSQSL
ncbi:Uncharacterised protein [Pasteurella multocida subsp. septica]|nr:Uncharacterised protein [Pasteurella multocida subsp. septica]